MHEFNQSLKYDKRMYDADIRGSIAYSKALTLVGILTKDEEVQIVNGLEAVRKEWDDGVVSPGSTVAAHLEKSAKLIQSQPVPSSTRRRGHPHREREATDRAYRTPRWKTTHRKVTKRPGRDRHAALANEGGTRDRNRAESPDPGHS